MHLASPQSITVGFAIRMASGYIHVQGSLVACCGIPKCELCMLFLHDQRQVIYEVDVARLHECI